MKKGYLVANLRVADQEIFKEFSSVALPLIEKYGGKLLARGPDAERHEGNVKGVLTIMSLKVKKLLVLSTWVMIIKPLKPSGIKG